MQKQTVSDSIRCYHGLDLPDAIIQHPSIQWLDRITREMMVM